MTLLAVESYRACFEDAQDASNGATFVVDEQGFLTVSVADDKAVDSYNQNFECSYLFTLEDFKALREWFKRTYILDLAESASRPNSTGRRCS